MAFMVRNFTLDDVFREINGDQNEITDGPIDLGGDAYLWLKILGSVVGAIGSLTALLVALHKNIEAVRRLIETVSALCTALYRRLRGNDPSGGPNLEPELPPQNLADDEVMAWRRERQHRLASEALGHRLYANTSASDAPARGRAQWI